MIIQNVFAVTACLFLGRAAATCYFPNGDVSGSDVACNSNAVDSFCCYSEQACLSNGLCETGEVAGIKQYARGTCTDPNWQSGACPNFCLDQQALGNVVYSCNITNSDEYCCNDGCSCTSGTTDEVLSFSGSPYTITVIGVTGTYPNPSATVSSSAATSSGSSSASTTTGLVATSGSQSSSSGASVTAAAATSSSAGQSTSSDSGDSNSVAIGAGVGVGVGAAILLAGAGAFWFYRRRSKARQNTGDFAAKSSPGLPTYSDDQSNHHTAQYHNPVTKPVPQPPAPVSELGSTGHGYSELAENRRSNVPELPGN